MVEEASPRQAEAQTYLNDHRVLELFDNLTSMLIFSRPEKPKNFLIDVLESLQASKTANLDTYPSLFNQSNMKSIYGMLDPTGRGHISKAEFDNAMETLGIREFVSPVASEASGPRDQAKESAEEDEEEEKIDLETFLSKCKEGLAKASATFKADSP